MTPKQRREFAELNLAYQRSQRREMDLALKAHKAGLTQYHKRPNAVHYAVDPDSEFRIKAAHVQREEESMLHKERINMHSRKELYSKIITDPKLLDQMCPQGGLNAYMTEHQYVQHQYSRAPKMMPPPQPLHARSTAQQAEAAAKAAEDKIAAQQAVNP